MTWNTCATSTVEVILRQWCDTASSFHIWWPPPAPSLLCLVLVARTKAWWTAATIDSDSSPNPIALQRTALKSSGEGREGKRYETGLGALGSADWHGWSGWTGCRWNGFGWASIQTDRTLANWVGFSYPFVTLSSQIFLEDLRGTCCEGFS